MTIRLTHAALTYSQTGDLFTKQELFDFLCALETDKVAVALEEHKDGKPHMHAYVHFPKRRTLSPKIFQFKDLTADCRILKTNSDSRRWLTYISKAGEPMSNFQIPLAQPGHKSKGIKDDIATRLLDDPDCLDELFKAYPGYSLNNHRHMQSFAIIARQLKKTPKREWTELPVPSDAPECHQRLRNWLNENIKCDRTFKQKQLWLWSELPDFGKTSLATALERYLKITQCVVMRTDYFNQYDDSTDLVVFDDYNSSNATTGLLNRFLQGSETTVPIKGGAIPKLKNPPVIFTSNKEPRMMYQNTYNLLEARLTIIELDAPIFPIIDELNKE